MTIYEKLANVQQALKAPKDQRNNFGNYNYRSCEGILEAVKPLLAKNELALTLTDEMVEVGGRIYVKATATVFNAGKDMGEATVSAEGYAREEENKKGMDSSQITGAASSYARKYALNGLFCIDDNKDSDATNTHGKNDPENTKKDPIRNDGGSEYYICAECGNPNHAFSKKDGSIMSPREMLALSMRDLGKPLCKDCYKKALAR